MKLYRPEYRRPLPTNLADALDYILSAAEHYDEHEDSLYDAQNRVRTFLVFLTQRLHIKGLLTDKDLRDLFAEEQWKGEITTDE